MLTQTTKRMPQVGVEEACRIQWWRVGLHTTPETPVAAGREAGPNDEQVGRRLKQAAAQSFAHGGED